MSRTAELGRTLSKEDYHQAVPVLRGGLLDAQQELRAAPFPVIVVFGGVDKGGKIETINLLNEWLDPRWLITRAYGPPSDEMVERPEEWHRFYGERPGWVFTHRELPLIPGVDITPVEGDVPPSVLSELLGSTPWGRSRLRQRLEVSRVDLLRVPFVVGHLVDRRFGGAPSSHILVGPRVVLPGTRRNLDLRPFHDFARVVQ